MGGYIDVSDIERMLSGRNTGERPLNAPRCPTCHGSRERMAHIAAIVCGPGTDAFTVCDQCGGLGWVLPHA